MHAKRTKKQATKHILLNEVLGFLGIILLIWLSEIPDLPAILFGVEKTPVNWSEMALESFGVLLLAIWVISMTANHLRQIQYLEGFLKICASCKKVHVGDKWVMLEQYIDDHSDTVISHGLCPECAEKFFAENDKITENPGKSDASRL